jgi:hypothetical protein
MANSINCDCIQTTTNTYDLSQEPLVEEWKMSRKVADTLKDSNWTPSQKEAILRKAIGNLPVIHCKCGKAILVVPDLKAMDRAIENHITIHNSKKPKGERVKETKRLREFLIDQVLNVVANS